MTMSWVWMGVASLVVSPLPCNQFRGQSFGGEGRGVSWSFKPVLLFFLVSITSTWSKNPGYSENEEVSDGSDLQSQGACH